MKTCAKTFSELTNTELYEIMRLRQDVFVVEQSCPYFDLDGVDYRSLHVFIEDSGVIAAYLRLFPRDGEEGVVQVGRVVTRERKKGYCAREIFSKRLLPRSSDIRRRLLRARGLQGRER